MILIGQQSDDEQSIKLTHGISWPPRGCAYLATAWGFSRNTSKQGPHLSYGLTNVGIRQRLKVEVWSWEVAES